MVVCVSTGCRDFVRYVDPELPAGAVALDPVPAAFGTWWAEVEQCSGLHGSMAGVRWFQVPQAPYFVYQGVEYDGMWWENRWILLAGAYLDYAPVVRHEMLHDLLRRTDHPPEYFQQKCGTKVSSTAG
jgi:hypothetical protein